MAARGWTASRLPPVDNKVQWSGIRIHYQPAGPITFALQFTTKDRSAMRFGIRAPHLDANTAEEAGQVLRNALGGTPGEGSWPWVRVPSEREDLLPMAGNWLASDTPWMQIASGELATAFVAAAIRFHGLLAKDVLGTAVADPPVPPTRRVRRSSALPPQGCGAACWPPPLKTQ